MKATSTLVWFALLASTATPALADGNTSSIYVRSNINQPWGQATNEDAMDAVFGAGHWTTMYYETVSLGDLLNSNTHFIFMEGGDSSFAGFETFMQANAGLLFNWIHSGGTLLIMSAPNDPLQSALVTLPDNIILYSDAFYGSAASSAFASDISNPIFNGPNTTSYYFTGDFFSHGYFAGTNMQIIMQSNLNEAVLGLDLIGSGRMVFGGMTTDNFHLPQPAAHSLLENIIVFTAQV